MHARRCLLWWMAAIVLSVGGCEGKLVGRNEEMRLGREAAQVIERRYRRCDDQDIQWLVEHIGRQVAARSARPDIDFTFCVLDQKEINALSVPGYVYVNRGLINAVNAEPDELAAVIAHEIAHTTERHVAKQLERIYGATFLLNALATGDSSVNTLADVAVQLALQGNSRQDERAADAQGLRFMSRAGYDPNAMVRFFEQLLKQTGESHGLNRYFATHPLTSDRIARARALIEKEHLAPASPAPPSSGN